MSFSKFEATTLKLIQPQIARIGGGGPEAQLAQRMGEFLLSRTSAPQLAIEWSPKDKYIGVLFSGFVEISESYYTLRDIESYVGRVTSRPSRDSKTRQLSYHVQNYLNENYILANRLKAYPAGIIRAARRYRIPHKRALPNLSPLAQVTAEVFRGIVNVRGRHIHRGRFTDDDLDRAGMLERVATTTTSNALRKPFRSLFNLALADARRKWAQLIATNNDEVLKLMDRYFEVMQMALFDEDGSLSVKHSRSAPNNSLEPTRTAGEKV